MAKRGGGGRRARGGDEGGLEVEDANAPVKPGLNMYDGMMFGMFVALLGALIALWKKSSADFGTGLFG